MPLYGFPISNAMPHSVPTVGLQREKRKMLEQHDTDIGVGDMEGLEQHSCPAKRHCKDIFPDPTGDNGIVVQHGNRHQALFSQTTPFSLCQQEPAPQHMASDELYGCMRDTGGTAHQTAASLPCQSVTPSQDMQQPVEMVCPMMMDGETYSPVSLDDLDLYCNGMDSDCTPDPSQYDLRVEYCSAPCTGGVRSPVSNSIRCACRPWETEETDYYHSDYY